LKPLTELKGQQPDEDGRRRRWFTSTDMDLVVWYDQDESISRFELYYDKNMREHVFIWKAEHGFDHMAVDDGEQQPALDYKETPILVPDGHVDPEHIRKLFEASCRDLPADVAALVLEKLALIPAS